MAEPLAIAARLIDTLIAEREAERARAEVAEAEVRALTARLDTAIQDSLALIQQREALTAQLDTAHTVIRKRAWNLPMTEADLTLEREVCDAWPRAATADPTPQTDTDDRCPCGARRGETCRPGCPIGPQAGGE